MYKLKEPNSLVEDVNQLIISRDYLFLVVKACVEQATHFESFDNWKRMPQIFLKFRIPSFPFSRVIALPRDGTKSVKLF